MTVSNVVNGKFASVSEATRARVQLEIERLNYRPHSSARSLRLSRRWSIGMIIIHESAAFLADPFITQVVAGLNKQLSEAGYGLHLQGVRRSELASSVLVRNSGTDGLCAFFHGSPRERRRIVEMLSSLCQPLILFQEPATYGIDDICCIREDDYEGGRILGQHLIERGARRFMLLEPALRWPATAERRRGLRNVVRGLPGASIDVVYCGHGDFASTQAALNAAIDKRGLPDAIMGSDHVAIAAMKLLRTRGASVPRDVLVTGFNGFEFWQYTDPMLTTIISPAYEMGRLAGREMLRRLDGGVFSKPDHVLKVTLQTGGST